MTNTFQVETIKYALEKNPDQTQFVDCAKRNWQTGPLSVKLPNPNTNRI